MGWMSESNKTTVKQKKWMVEGWLRKDVDQIDDNMMSISP